MTSRKNSWNAAHAPTELRRLRGDRQRSRALLEKTAERLSDTSVSTDSPGAEVVELEQAQETGVAGLSLFTDAQQSLEDIGVSLGKVARLNLLTGTTLGSAFQVLHNQGFLSVRCPFQRR